MGAVRLQGSSTLLPCTAETATSGTVNKKKERHILELTSQGCKMKILIKMVKLPNMGTSFTEVKKILSERRPFYVFTFYTK